MATGQQPEKAKSAYHQYQADAFKKIKAEGRSSDTPGALLKEISDQWKALSEQEKAKYEKSAEQDRLRYERECELRDKEADEESARRRAEREEVLPEGQRRACRVEEQAEKPKRVAKAEEDMTEEELQAKRDREAKRKAIRDARLEREAEIARQRQALQQERAATIQKRLRYLMESSDIFQTHFGVSQAGVAGDPNFQAAPPTSAAGGITSPAKHRQSVEAPDSAAGAEEGMEEMEGEGTEAEPIRLVKQPPSLQGELRSYQLEGLNWLINLQHQGVNGILADEMGLGKTLQSISILSYTHDFKGHSGPHLVLLPKSTLSNWVNEFRRFCPTLRTVRFHGNKEERQHTVDTVLKPGAKQEDREWDVCLTTYEICNLERLALSRISWRYLIIDEAHRLKNEQSLFAQTVRDLDVQHRLLLTGTPLQNNLHELWALLNFLLPDVFASSEQFNEFFNLNIEDDTKKQNMISQLHKILRPFMLRRLKADVEKSLPAKSETVLFIGMSAVQKNLYRQILMRDIDVINGSSTQRTAVLNICMQLRKCCNHPYLFPNVEDRTEDPLGSHMVDNCGKMILLDKLLKKLKEKGHRVLVFSQMTRMLDILEDYMVMRQYQYCRIDGNTSYDEREDMIDDYNRAGSEKFIFLLSTRAGGLGINLQTADTVILYDSDWNPQADLQAQDRAHRIGQKKPVQVYRLVTENTIEEKVVERAQQKLKLDAMIVQQGRLTQKEQMSKDALLDALRFGADHVFRSKDADITDEDIDALMARGAERTAQLNEKLKKAEKGDLLDFKLDGGIKTQQFEGKDYSDRSMREKETLQRESAKFFLDVGKRERRPVTESYSGVRAVPPSAPKNKFGVRLPKELNLPPIKPWQFFDREGLWQIQETIMARFKEMKDMNQDMPENPQQLEALLVTPEVSQEKAQLLRQGFADWNHENFAAFRDGCGQHGRENLAAIAADVGKSEEEVGQYAEAFWSRGPEELINFDKIVADIERGERKRNEVTRVTDACQKLLARWQDPWSDFKFKHAPPRSGQHTEEEDRLMLCYAVRYGWGAWAQVREAVLACPELCADSYLRSLPRELLYKRFEHIMRQAEKELQELISRGAADREKARADRRAQWERDERFRQEAIVRDQAVSKMDMDIEATQSKIKAALSAKHTWERDMHNVELDILKAARKAEAAREAAKERAREAAREKAREAAQAAAREAAREAERAARAATSTPQATQQFPYTGGHPNGPSMQQPLQPASALAATQAITSPAGPVSYTGGASAAGAPPSKAAHPLRPANKSPGPRADLTLNGAVHKPSASAPASASAGKKTDSIVPRKTFEIPVDLLPELTRLIHSAGTEGVSHIANRFHQRHPIFSIRQIVNKIKEVGVREARTELADNRTKWYVLPPFAMYLHSPVREEPLPEEADYAQSIEQRRAKKLAKLEKEQRAAAEAQANGASPPQTSSLTPMEVEGAQLNGTAHPLSTTAPQTPATLPSPRPKTKLSSPSTSSHKRKHNFLSGSAKMLSTTKRKRSAEATSPRGNKMPKKKAVDPSLPVTGFTEFCREHRKLVKAAMREDDDKEVMYQKLRDMWADLAEAKRNDYDQAAKAVRDMIQQASPP